MGRTGSAHDNELGATADPGLPRFAQLFLTRHAFHGEWNYTLHPAQSPGPSGDQAAADPPTAPSPDRLSDPRLTGMSEQELHDLTTALHASRQAHRQARQQQATQQALHEGRKPHAPRSGRPAQFGFGDQVLATILHLRLSLPHEALAVLFNRSRTTIRRAITDVRHLFDQQGTTIQPVTVPGPLTDILANQTTSTR